MQLYEFAVIHTPRNTKAQREPLLRVIGNIFRLLHMAVWIACPILAYRAGDGEMAGVLTVWAMFCCVIIVDEWPRR